MFCRYKRCTRTRAHTQRAPPPLSRFSLTLQLCSHNPRTPHAHAHVCPPPPAGTRLQKLPPVLSLGLNRFRYDWENDRREKVKSRFAFPTQLNFSAYCDNQGGGKGGEGDNAVDGSGGDGHDHGGDRGDGDSGGGGDAVSKPPADTPTGQPTTESCNVKVPSAAAAAAAAAPSPSQQYVLYSVVIHSGSAGSGHYTALVNDLKEEGVWEEKTGICADDFSGGAGNAAAAAAADETGSQYDVVAGTGSGYAGFEADEAWTTVDKKKKKRKGGSKASTADEAATAAAAAADAAVALPPHQRRWFDVNDSFIKSVDESSLETTFYGDRCGYMLFYVSAEHAAACRSRELVLPPAIAAEIAEQNAGLEVRRTTYETLENEVQVHVHYPSEFQVEGHCLAPVAGGVAGKGAEPEPSEVSADPTGTAADTAAAVVDGSGAVSVALKFDRRSSFPDFLASLLKTGNTHSTENLLEDTDGVHPSPPLDI